MTQSVWHGWVHQKNEEDDIAPTTHRKGVAHVGIHAAYTLPKNMAPVSAHADLSKHMK